MKKILLLSLVMIICGCAAYRPTHEQLVKNGFELNKVSDKTRIFDTYNKKLKSKYFIQLGYNVGINEWALWAGRDGVPVEYIKFYINSKKEFKMVMSTIK